MFAPRAFDPFLRVILFEQLHIFFSSFFPLSFFSPSSCHFSFCCWLLKRRKKTRRQESSNSESQENTVWIVAGLKNRREKKSGSLKWLCYSLLLFVIHVRGTLLAGRRRKKYGFKRKDREKRRKNEKEEEWEKRRKDWKVKREEKENEEVIRFFLPTTHRFWWFWVHFLFPLLSLLVSFSPFLQNNFLSKEGSEWKTCVEESRCGSLVSKIWRHFLEEMMTEETLSFKLWFLETKTTNFKFQDFHFHVNYQFNSWRYFISIVIQILLFNGVMRSGKNCKTWEFTIEREEKWEREEMNERGRRKMERKNKWRE